MHNWHVAKRKFTQLKTQKCVVTKLNKKIMINVGDIIKLQSLYFTFLLIFA